MTTPLNPTGPEIVKNSPKIYHVEGYEAFCQFMDEFTPAEDEIVHVLFEGAKDPRTNKSWCTDCIASEPIIESKLELLPTNSHFIIVAVGDRAYWKDQQCPFRTDKRTALNVIPTLIRWQKPQRLAGEQLENPDLVEMLFVEED